MLFPDTLTGLFLWVSQVDGPEEAGKLLPLETALQDLEKKHRQESETVRGFDSEVARRERDLDEVSRELREDRMDGAPLVAEERDYVRVDSLGKQARTAIREKNYGLLPDLMDRVRRDADGMQNLMPALKAKSERARELARQADLLVLRSRTETSLDYTVLLRTPSKPGTHGINIQDSSSVVEDDRDWMGQMVDQVMSKAQEGSRRGGTEVISAPAMADAPPAAVPADQIRTFERDSAEAPSDEDCNEFIKVLGDMMYRLLIPEGMHSYFSHTKCSFTITTNDLSLPWELMSFEDVPRGEKKVLCLERAMARMPMGRAIPRTISTKRRPSKVQFLLIYSDPDQNLPAARVEIDSIYKALHGEWADRIDVKRLSAEEVTGPKLNDLLRKGEFDVIHYAGHASFHTGNPDLSGLLLAKKVPFYAQKIRRLLEGQPLVFLNACESGATANEDQPQKIDYLLRKPAAGLASAFVYGGALGCIGSLWSIYDEPAAEFAVAFYRHVLNGEMIGEALRIARIQSARSTPIKSPGRHSCSTATPPLGWRHINLRLSAGATSLLRWRTPRFCRPLKRGHSDMIATSRPSGFNPVAPWEQPR